MKTIGIIGAMEEEVALLKEKIDVVSIKEMLGLEFVIGTYFDKRVVVVRCGIGKVNAAICTQALIDHFAVDYVINVGVAGAIHKDLNIGDILISDSAAYHDFDTSPLGDPIGFISRMNVDHFDADKTLVDLSKKIGEELVTGHKVIVGRVASGDQFICSNEVKEKIKKNVKGDCAEMEGAAIAHACYLNKIPFVIIRSISDNADGSADMSFEEFCPIAAKNSSDFVEKIVELL